MNDLVKGILIAVIIVFGYKTTANYFNSESKVELISNSISILDTPYSKSAREYSRGRTLLYYHRKSSYVTHRSADSTFRDLNGMIVPIDYNGIFSSSRTDSL